MKKELYVKKNKKRYRFGVLLLCVGVICFLKWKDRNKNIMIREFQNVYIESISQNSMVAMINGKYEKFHTKDIDMPVENCFADVKIYGDYVTKIRLKSCKVTGKIRKIKKNTIEIEGYGERKIQENATFLEKESRKLSNKERLCVGNQTTEFFLEQDQICGAIIDSTIQDQIRVLISTSNYKGIYHKRLCLMAEGDYKIITGKNSLQKKKNEQVVLDKGSSFFLDTNCIKIQCMKKEQGIILQNVERAKKKEPYPGCIYVMKDQQGLVVINELDLETYLSYVVCSEIPDSYEKEALKAQAICARTYALKQLKGHRYEEYGANLDDSVMSQVYHNYVPSSKIKQAVSDTKGIAIYYKNTPIDAYFFSTSCGVTSDAMIWSTKGKPYLKGKVLGKTELVDLNHEKEFRAFIKNDYDAYDSKEPYFRWQTEWEKEELQSHLESTYHVKLGKITAIKVLKRGTNGIALLVKVQGKKDSILLKGELEIRKQLLLPKQKIMLKDGSIRNDLTMLPSAYVTFEIKDNQIIGFGGGYGHGVGASQNAMNQMAKEGKRASEILTFFYNGVEVK